jgi:spore coat protein U-like protein
MKSGSVIASTLVVAPLLVVGAVWQAPAVSAQGQSTANMLVVTSVMRKCFVQTAPLDFGTYDPVQANATASLDGQSTLTVSCTKGTVVTIGIDDGANASGQVRRMASGAASYLNYDLYQDEARTLRWGSAAGQTFNGGIAPSRDPRQFIVYGRVPGAQDVAEGAFQDTVLVTVDF